MIAALIVVSAAAAGACVALIGVLLFRRLVSTRRDGRRAQDERRLSVRALAVIDGEADVRSGLSTRDAAVVSGLLARYARNLDGTARRHIGEWFEDRSRLDATIHGLADRRTWRRAAAAHALGDMSSSRAVAPLLGALVDPARDVRAAAARSLGRLGDPSAVGPLIEALVGATVPRAVAGQALIALASDALPALRECAGSVVAEVRRNALDLIGVVGSAGDATLCARLLRDASADVRVAAAVALGRLGAAGAVPLLVEALDDRLPFVRAAAAGALGQIGDPSALPALLAEAVGAAPEAAQAAAHAVLRIDPDALAATDLHANGSRFLREAVDLAELRAA